MKNYIVESTCNRLVRQVTLAILSMPDTGRIAVVGNEKTRNLRWTSFCSENSHVSFEPKDEAAFLETVNTLAEKMPDSILIPTDCDAARVVTRVKEKLLPKIVPIPESAMLETLDNKWRFFHFCRQHEIRVPDTVYIGAKSNLNFSGITNMLGLPFVLKPVNQAGSNGVHVVRSEAYFKEAIENNDAYKFNTLIAQKYIAGTDLCFNFLASRGEISACSIQQRYGPEIRFVNCAALETLGYALARASAYDGVMCIDARVEEKTGDVYLIESNPRFWASLCASVWCGLNFVAEAVAPNGTPDSPIRLTSGRYYERHPLYRPSSWLKLMFDASRQGKMFRAMMSDLPTISELACSLPTALWNYAVRRLTPRQVTSVINQ